MAEVTEALAEGVERAREEAEASAASTLQVADNLAVVLINPQDLHEQTVNAQMMNPREFDQLVDNVAQRGQLESLPYCWQKPGTTRIEIVSGHHRVRAANAAGLERIPVLLDTSEMSRSTLVAKQIAHNQLVGTSDEATLRVMLEMVTDVDDMILSGLPDTFLPVAEPVNVPLDTPRLEFDWRTVQLMFLPRQMERFEGLIDEVEKQSELVGVADVDQFKAFSKALVDYGYSMNIKSMSAVVDTLTALAVREVEAAAEAAALEASGESEEPVSEE